MPFNYAENGSLLPFTNDQVSAMGIETANVEDGTHPVFTKEVNQTTMQAEYFVWSNQLDNFWCFMLGGAVKYFDPDTSSYQLSRLLPQQLEYEGVDYQNFAAVKIDGTTGHQFLEDDNSSNRYPIPNYTKTRVRVLFQEVPFNLLNDEETTSETQRYFQQLPTNSQVDYLSLTGGVGKYVNYPGGGAGLPSRAQVTYGPGFPTSLSTLTQKWIRLPYDCWGVGSDLYTTIFGDPSVPGGNGLIGTVNQFDFLGYASSTLLWLAPEEELVIDQASATTTGSTPQLAWNLTYKWLFKPQGHNYQYWFPAGGPVGNGANWYQVTVDGLNTYYPDDSAITSQQCFFANSNFQLGFQV